MQREDTNSNTQTSTPEFAAHEPVIAQSKARRLYLIIGIAVVALILLYGLYELITAGKESTDDAVIAADVVPIASRVAGQVITVPVQENQLVHKGDLIAVIDPSDYQVKVLQAQGDFDTAQAQAQQADAKLQVSSATAKGGLAMAQANVASSRENVDSQSDAINVANAQLVRAQANANKASLDYKRAEELGGKGDIPRAQVDAARAANEAAQADVVSARAQVQSAIDAKQRAEAGVQQAQGQLTQSNQVPAQIASAQAEAALAHAKLASSKAALKAAQLNLSYTEIHALSDGYAARLGVHPGQLVTIGQPIVQLVPPHTYIVANFKETQVKEMKPGQSADIEVDVLKGKKYEGKIESLSGGTGSSFSVLPPDNASGNFVKVVQRVPVRISWNGPPSAEAPVGSSADVTVHTK